MTDQYIRHKAIASLAEILRIKGCCLDDIFFAADIPIRQFYEGDKLLDENDKVNISYQQFAEFYVQSRAYLDTDSYGLDPDVNIPFGVHRLGLMQLEKHKTLSNLYQFDPHSKSLLNIKNWPFYVKNHEHGIRWYFHRTDYEEGICKSLVHKNDALFIYWWVILMSWLVDEPVTISRVGLMHDNHDDFYAQLFKSTIEYEAEAYYFEIPHYYSNLKLQRSKSDIRKLCDNVSMGFSYGMNNNLLTWSDKVKKSIRNSIDLSISMEAVAEHYCISTSTLKRNLQGEQQKFQTIKDQCRLEMALDTLQSSDKSISDIAYEVGYSNPSSFYRAFKGWTGKTPFSYREQ